MVEEWEQALRLTRRRSWRCTCPTRPGSPAPPTWLRYGEYRHAAPVRFDRPHHRRRRVHRPAVPLPRLRRLVLPVVAPGGDHPGTGRPARRGRPCPTSTVSGTGAAGPSGNAGDPTRSTGSRCSAQAYEATVEDFTGHAGDTGAVGPVPHPGGQQRPGRDRHRPGHPLPASRRRPRPAPIPPRCGTGSTPWTAGCGRHVTDGAEPRRSAATTEARHALLEAFEQLDARLVRQRVPDRRRAHRGRHPPLDPRWSATTSARTPAAPSTRACTSTRTCGSTPGASTKSPRSATPRDFDDLPAPPAPTAPTGSADGMVEAVAPSGQVAGGGWWGSLR